MSATMQFIYIHTMYPLRCVTWSSEYHDEWKQDGRERPCVVHFLSLRPIDLFQAFFFLSCVFLAHEEFHFSPFCFRFTNVSNLLLANVLHVCTYITCSSGPTTFIYVNDVEEGKFFFPFGFLHPEIPHGAWIEKIFHFPFLSLPIVWL